MLLLLLKKKNDKTINPFKPFSAPSGIVNNYIEIEDNKSYMEAMK